MPGIENSNLKRNERLRKKRQGEEPQSIHSQYGIPPPKLSGAKYHPNNLGPENNKNNGGRNNKK